MHDEDLRGAVAEASNGSIGVIYKQKKISEEWVWVGLSFNGNPWSSRRPKILAYTVHEYVARQIEDRIVNERKAYLDAIRRLKPANSSKEGRKAIEECVNTINVRAASRREERKLCPVTTQQAIDDVRNSLNATAIDPNMVIVSHSETDILPLENPELVDSSISGAGGNLLESLRRTG